MKRLLRALGWVALGWMAWRLLGPDRQPRYPVPQVRPLHVPGRTVFSDEWEFFVRETGPSGGTPIVLLHGLAFDGEMTFYRLIPLLADRYRLIIPDQRSSGKTDRVRGRIEIADLADDLAGVLDQLGVERCHVLGYSMGGMVAQEFARRHPNRVDRLMLAATAARPIDRARPLVRVLAWMVRAPIRISRTEQALVNYRVLTRTGTLAPEHRRWLWNGMLARDASLYFEAVRAIWRFDSRAWVGELGPRVLQFVTTPDPVVPTGAQRRLSGLLRDPSVVEVAGGHEAVIAQPEVFAEAIERFVGDAG